MIRNQKEWYDWCMKRGTSGDQVFQILNDWEEDRRLSQKLCEIYFVIAADVIGEEVVRSWRDAALEKEVRGLSDGL